MQELLLTVVAPDVEGETLARFNAAFSRFNKSVKEELYASLEGNDCASLTKKRAKITTFQ